MIITVAAIIDVVISARDERDQALDEVERLRHALRDERDAAKAAKAEVERLRGEIAWYLAGEDDA